MTGIGLKIKELRMERDLTMEMLVADMNAKEVKETIASNFSFL